MSAEKGTVALEWSTAAVALVGGIVVAVVGAGYGLSNVTGVGAGFFPTVAGALVALAGLMWLVQLAVSRRMAALVVAPAADATDFERLEAGFEADDEIDEEGDDAEIPDRAGWIRVGIIVGSILAAALLLNVLGYTISMTLLLGTVLLFVSRRPWWLALVVGAGAALGSRFIFENLLGTVLPGSSIELLAMMGV